MKPSDIERFWSKAIPEPNSGCWIWTASLTGTGYGIFRLGSLKDGSRRMVTASRFACELAHGSIPDGLMALHHCDNKLCINPDHLYIGTGSDNANDAFSRGRKIPHRMKGETNPNCKLSGDDVATIRASQKRGADLAREFGVSKTHIGYIRSGKSWGDGNAA